MAKATIGMPCPVEGCPGATFIHWSRLSGNRQYRLRRRVCRLCHSRRTTRERYVGAIVMGQVKKPRGK